MRDLFAGVVPFVFTAQERSFRRAAERLGVTPAAVSKAIARLEEDVGIALLRRTTRRVELTREGELFLTRCREAMAQVTAGRERVAMAQRDPAGEITVSLPFVLGRPLVARLPRFRTRYPDLRLHLRLTDRVSRLVDEGVDVALRMGDLADSSLVARRVVKTRWVTVAAPGYLAERGTPQAPSELAAHDCLSFRGPRGADVPWTFATRGDVHHLSPKPAIDLDQGDLLLDAAIAGLGVAQVLGFMADPALRRGRLVEVLADHAAPGPAVHALCLPGQRTLPRVRALLDFLVEALADRIPYG